MTSDKSRLTDLVLREGGYVTFGDNNKGRIMGEKNIGNQHNTQIKMFCMLMDISTIF